MAVPTGLETVMNEVRNIRQFRADPVPDEALTAVLEAARWTGSAMNRQPWEFVVVRDADLLRALAATSPHVGWVAGAPLAIVPVMAGEAPELETYDEGRVSERIMLAARARGLGSGLGWFSAASARSEAKALLGVPAEREVRTVVAVGYPARTGAGRGGDRKPLAELAFGERYGRPLAE